MLLRGYRVREFYYLHLLPLTRHYQQSLVEIHAIHFRSFMTVGPAHQFFVKNYFFLRQMAFLEIIRQSSAILGKMAEEHLEAKM